MAQYFWNPSRSKFIKNSVLAFGIILFISLAANFLVGHKPSVSIGTYKLSIEVADDDQERFRGLSGRDTLCDRCGMLFLFPVKEARIFVMREMLIPLDIIWIDSGKIVRIDKGLEPEGKDFSKFYPSKSPVDMVLEVNAGISDKLGFKPGDNVDISL